MKNLKKCIKKYRQDENGSLSIFILFASEAGKPTAAASATQIFLARFKQEALQFVPYSHFLGGLVWGRPKRTLKRVEHHSKSMEKEKVGDNCICLMFA